MPERKDARDRAQATVDAAAISVQSRARYVRRGPEHLG